MWSGISALDQLDSTLHSLRSEAIRVDQQLAQLSQRYTNAEQRRLHVVHQIARVRLASIDQGELSADLNSADKEVKQLLKQRSQALEGLHQRIEQASQFAQELEGSRFEQLGKVNDIAKQLADTQAQVQDNLLDDLEYLDSLNKATVAQSVMLESRAKVDIAKANMAEKAAPYQADELFIYLWERGYGTTEYTAGLFARWMDARVARLIEYEPKRVNYWNLSQIPLRLEHHADNVTEQAEQAAQLVEDIEAARLEAAGMLTLNALLDTLREELDRLDDKLEVHEADLNELLQERALFIAGDDTFSRQGLSRLAQAMDHRDLDAVYRYVLATSSLSDDELVLELSDLDQQCRVLKADTQDLRKLHESQISRLKDIEGVRRNFKDARFDDASSGFDNPTLVQAALGQFVQGMLTGGDLWGALKRNQRFKAVKTQRRSNSSFGSDSLRKSSPNASRRVPRARSKGRGSWQWTQPRSRSGSARSPKKTSASGGFKTGGSF